MYNATKIRITILEQMEQGEFSMVPQPFIRAFLREYAGVIGVDPERVIQRYEKKIDYISKPEPPAPQSVTSDIAKSSETKQTKPEPDSIPTSDKLNVKKKKAFGEETLSVTTESDESTEPSESVTTPASDEPVLPQVVEQQPSLFNNAPTEQQQPSSETESIGETDQKSAIFQSNDIHKLNEPKPKSTPSIRQHLEIEEPSAMRNIIFVVFFIIIIIAALVIFWINRGY